MTVFNIEFSIRKGLGPDWFDKNISVGLDDLPEDLTDKEIENMAINEAESYLYKSEDYPLYGKNWFIKEVYKD